MTTTIIATNPRRAALRTPGWIGVDLDGSLAKSVQWRTPLDIGEPIPLMVARVRAWLARGMEVRILTARVSPVSLAANEVSKEAMVTVIQAWCLKNVGAALPVTCEKDLGMRELWDDRAVQLVPDTGLRADGRPD